MIKLRFDKALHQALTKRVAQYLQETDAGIARRIETMEEGAIAAIPEASELYEQALTMLVTEVLCNVAAALRSVFGPSDDQGRLAIIVAQALRKTVEARAQSDATRKERTS